MHFETVQEWLHHPILHAAIIRAQNFWKRQKKKEPQKDINNYEHALVIISAFTKA